MGNLADCEMLESLVNSGAVIVGGSAYRYCKEFEAFLARPESERGEVRSLFGSIGLDNFNYGIHIIESLGRFVPKGAQSVRCVGNEDSGFYHIQYESGVKGVYHLNKGIWRPLVLIVNTSKGTFVIQPAINKLYGALLKQVFNFIEKKEHMVAIDELTESIKIALAGKASRELEGAEVKLENLNSEIQGYSGNGFATYYAKL